MKKLPRYRIADNATFSANSAKSMRAYAQACAIEAPALAWFKRIDWFWPALLAFTACGLAVAFI